MGSYYNCEVIKMRDLRNIVLITLDSVRADHCSFMGYHRRTTPTLDKIAKRSLVFENAIASGPGTPVSMTGVFTGDYAPIYGMQAIEWRKLFNKRITLAQVLKNIGYTTVAFNPNIYVSRYFGFNKGFTNYYDFTQDNNSICLKLLRRFKITRYLINFINKKEVFIRWEDFYHQLIECLKNIEKPFFLWVLLLDTHYPYFPPSRYRTCSAIKTLLINYKIFKYGFKPNLSTMEKRKLIDLYDACIRYADAFIHNLIMELSEYDPIYIIHADHGEAFGEHNGLYGHNHGYLYEELIHVPLIIYNADLKRCIEDPISLLGLAPTIMELIGKKNEFPSNSFLHGGDNWVVSKVFDGSKWRIAIRAKRFKFITGQKEEDELYYLKEDPYEQKNVINEYPELAKEMRRIVEIHVKQEMEKRKIRERISRIKTVKVDKI
ncbi:MAG: hypothetical protein DRZ80_03620 [Thermoprotei archaeon]|nr:MAG: hypothetical protein DRZ80_03620 [Thermoprotei archaeon]